ncbi:unnamed protein product [Taenia asiatica]|uniref:3-oxoacyl-[acyl-carrier-protein] reductase n=1 Tax=Taenia asiatica TaxID=60517 RepID=A0A0R3W7K9_TAEAS|nr:unnamed protein product [Taenia asiatica]
MDISLLGKTALVTACCLLIHHFLSPCKIVQAIGTFVIGASSGIGRSTAVLFAKLGAGVSLVGRNEVSLEKTRQMCQDASSNPEANFHVVRADFAELDQVSGAFNETIKHFGKLDILVNNAGFQLRDSVENFDPIAYERLMNVNVRSVIVLSHLAVPKLEESKGCIVNVSSVSGNNSFPGILSYSISKAAIEQFTRNAAVELGKKGIRVNCVAPGVVVTELHRTAGYSEAEYASFLMRARSNNLVGATGEADDVARAIAFLAASATGAFITGETIFVDGGWSKMCPR